MNLDESVSSVCSITKGDLPVKIWWSFRGDGDDYTQNLTTNDDGIVIARSSQRHSLLTIDAVKAHHRGNYSCHAQNKAGSTQHSVFLHVNGLNQVHQVHLRYE